MGNIFTNTRQRSKDQLQIKITSLQSDKSQFESVHEQNSQSKKAFQSLDQQYQRILSFAISNALSRMASEQFIKAEQQEKKIISSLNRYYQQKKNSITQIDAQNMGQTDYEAIIRILRRHHFFKQLYGLLSAEKNFITMFLLSIKKKSFIFRDYIYKQFDASSNFYIIAEGKLLVELNSMALKPLSKNEYFGLQSIIYDSEQAESVKVKSPTAILYQISKEQILKVQQKINLENRQQNYEMFQQNVVFFNFLNHKEKQQVLKKIVKSTYSKGQIIFERDYESNAFFVIQKGEVLIKIPQKKDLILGAGSSFGESSFNQKKVHRHGKAIAYQNDTIILEIGSRSILKTLGNRLDCAVLQNSLKWALYRDFPINQLFFCYKFNMENLLSRFKLKKCQKSQILGRKGDKSQKIFINVRCEINLIKEMTVFYGDQVGQLVKDIVGFKQQGSLQAIRQKIEELKKNLVYPQDIVVTERGIYGEADLKQVVQLIIRGEKQNQQEYRVDLSVGKIQKYAKLRSKNGVSTIFAVEKHFNMQLIIKTYHKNKAQNHIFTQKTFVTIGSKHRKGSFSMEQNDAYQMLNQEKQIIQKLNHPHICGFYKVQENQNNYFLLNQYIKGVTLDEIHEELGVMPQVLIKFYVLNLAFMLTFMHQNGIIYRNLRPQKILIDNTGFPNIFDFKYSKQANRRQNYQTSTLIKPPHYCPPQAIGKKSYSYEVDFWQLGVILYELIYQQLPFGDDLQDPMEIYTEILSKQPNLKKINSSSALKDLLQKNPRKRIKRFHELAKQSYFHNFDWQAIQSQNIIPPYIHKNPTKRFGNAEVFIRSEQS